MAGEPARVWRGESLEASPQTLGRMLLARSEDTPDAPAMRFRVETRWHTLTFREYTRHVREIALGFLALGLSPGETVLLASQTRYEWNLVDFAVLLCGGVVVPAFPTLLAKTILHQALDSTCTIAVVEDREQLTKVLEVRSYLPALRLIITIDRTGEEGFNQVYNLADVHRAGQKRPELEQELDRRIEAVRPEDRASIVYTSGTTGVPRGVVLSHWNLIAASAGSLQVLPIRESSVNLIVLPLAHAYQRVVNIGTVMRGAETAYSTPRTMAQDFLEVRPTVMAGVPRLYERIYERVVEEVRGRGWLAERVFAWARRVAIDRAKAQVIGESPSGWTWLKRGLANRLVFRRIRDGLGGRVELLVSGASALREDLAWFYNGVGLPLLEGYGLTETAAPSNVNPMGRVRPGTVGPPIPGAEETLAEDGEILIRGPIVSRSYHNLPEATAEAFTPDGWFRTGDFGSFDADGYLRFRGRKKELLKLSTAKFVAPGPIEQRLKESPLIEDAVVIGDDRKYAAAVIQPLYENLARRLKEAGASVPESALVWGTTILGERVIDGMAPEVLGSPEAQRLLQAEIDRVNGELDPHEQVVRFLLVPRRFTIGGEELTPTLKVRRDTVLRKYAREIETLYA